jgi:hypothetical protein
MINIWNSGFINYFLSRGDLASQRSDPDLVFFRSYPNPAKKDRTSSTDVQVHLCVRNTKESL